MAKNQISSLGLKFKPTRRRLVIAFILLLIIIGVQLIRSRNNLLKTELHEVKRQDITESITASGKVYANQAVTLAFQTGGKVAWLGVKEGEKVVKGQALAHLDKTSFNAAHEQAISELRKYQATAERALDSVKGHDTDESFTQKDTRTTAEANRDSAYRQTEITATNLKNATLISPFDGIVSNIDNLIAPGANILVTTPAISVVNPETIYFEAEVNETEVVKLSVGQKAEIRLDAFDNETFEGEITHMDYMSTTTSTGGTAYKIKITLSQKDGLIYRLGMNGDAEFVISSKKDVLALPSTAIVDRDDKTYVWVVDGGSTKEVEVKTGISSVNTVEIVSGVEEGAVVIKRPPADIKEGVRVKSS